MPFVSIQQRDLAPIGGCSLELVIDYHRKETAGTSVERDVHMALLDSINVQNEPIWKRFHTSKTFGSSKDRTWENLQRYPEEEGPVLIDQVAKPKKYLRINSKGSIRFITATRHRLAARLNIPYCDLRGLEPPSVMHSSTTAIFARENAMVLVMESMRCIITDSFAMFLTVPDDNSPGVPVEPTQQSLFVRELRRRVVQNEQDDVYEAQLTRRAGFDTGLPFEFVVLEAVLSTAIKILDRQLGGLERVAIGNVEAMARQVNSETLEGVREVKQRANKLVARVSRVQRELEEKMNDDDQLAGMYLTRRRLVRDGATTGGAAAQDGHPLLTRMYSTGSRAAEGEQEEGAVGQSRRNSVAAAAVGANNGGIGGGGAAAAGIGGQHTGARPMLDGDHAARAHGYWGSAAADGGDGGTLDADPSLGSSSNLEMMTAFRRKNSGGAGGEQEEDDRRRRAQAMAWFQQDAASSGGGVDSWGGQDEDEDDGIRSEVDGEDEKGPQLTTSSSFTRGKTGRKSQDGGDGAAAGADPIAENRWRVISLFQRLGFRVDALQRAPRRTHGRFGGPSRQASRETPDLAMMAPVGPPPDTAHGEVRRPTGFAATAAVPAAQQHEGGEKQSETKGQAGIGTEATGSDSRLAQAPSLTRITFQRTATYIYSSSDEEEDGTAGFRFGSYGLHPQMGGAGDQQQAGQYPGVIGTLEEVGPDGVLRQLQVVGTPQVEQLEDLLELYSTAAEQLALRLQILKERIDDTEDLVNLQLDHRRNELVALDMIATIGSFSLAPGTFLAGVFGMNLLSNIEDSHSAFVSVALMCSVVCIAIFAGMLGLAQYKRLLSVPNMAVMKRTDRRTQWLD